MILVVSHLRRTVASQSLGESRGIGQSAVSETNGSICASGVAQCSSQVNGPSRWLRLILSQALVTMSLMS